MNSSHTDQLSTAMRRSMNFRQGSGEVHVNLSKKVLTAFFYLFFAVFSPRRSLQKPNG